VPLAQVTLDVLAVHLARFPAIDNLVFTSTERRPWRRGTFAELIRQAREDAGLSATVTFHDLRHHYAPALIAAGCSIKAVQEALGHRAPARHSTRTRTCSRALRTGYGTRSRRCTARRVSPTCHGSPVQRSDLGGDGEPACKPDSVRRFPGGHRPGGHPSVRPTWGHVPGQRPLLGLAPGGGCQPPGSPPTLVRSYRTVSPLPVRATGGPASRHRRSALCCPEPAGRPVLALASTLALWSPDFPRHLPAPRPPGRLTVRPQVTARGRAIPHRMARIRLDRHIRDKAY